MALEDTASRRPSKSGDAPKPVLSEVGEQILTALEGVARSAQRALTESSGISRDSLVRPSNMMVGDANPEKTIHAKNVEKNTALRKLLEEPLVARVDVDWSPEGRAAVQTIYFPRRSTGGLGVPGVQFVSSFAALGQLAEYEAGEIATIDVNGRTRTGRILKQALFAPTRKEGLWDALVSNFGVAPWGDVLRLLGHESLRVAVAAIARDLKGPIAAAQPLFSERNIPIMGYKGGFVVGDAREVRIFDVQHIKGMEFEAVFFVGIDRLAERIPGLFLRFLYVGVTRAATYLGITCETLLPNELETVRSHFKSTSWAEA